MNSNANRVGMLVVLTACVAAAAGCAGVGELDLAASGRDRWQRPDELVHRRNNILGGSAGLARSFGIMPALKSLEKSEALGTEILPEWVAGARLQS